MNKLENTIAYVGYIFDCLTALRNILETGDCNNCETKDCIYKPKAGQMVRYNCPFYEKESDNE